MIPIKDNCVTLLKYDDLRKYRLFDNNVAFEKFILLLKNELHLIDINEELIKKNAKKLYDFRIANPNTSMAKRCSDFQLLEQKCKEYLLL